MRAVWLSGLGRPATAWRAGRELGLKVQINTTVAGHNLTDLAEIAAVVHRLGAVSWSAFLTPGWGLPTVKTSCTSKPYTTTDMGPSAKPDRAMNIATAPPDVAALMSVRGPRSLVLRDR